MSARPISPEVGGTDDCLPNTSPFTIPLFYLSGWSNWCTNRLGNRKAPRRGISVYWRARRDSNSRPTGSKTQVTTPSVTLHEQPRDFQFSWIMANHPESARTGNFLGISANVCFKRALAKRSRAADRHRRDDRRQGLLHQWTRQKTHGKSQAGSLNHIP